jgi:hypothetical protein
MIVYNISWEYSTGSSQLGKLLSWQPVRYGKGRRYGPSITYKITPAGLLSSSQPGGQPCWTSPLDFGLIGPTEYTVLLSGVHSVMRVKLALAGKGGVHAHPLSLHLPSPVKLQCTLQLSGRYTNPVSSLVKICTLWPSHSPPRGGRS